MKYISSYWEEEINKIKAFFESNPTAKYWNCPQICHGMISGGIVHTIMIQAVHIIRWQQQTGNVIQNINGFVELGGGTGNMARNVRAVNKSPYTIIDIPEIHKIQQWVNKGEDFLYYDTERLDDFTTNAEMFISCFALNETSPACIEKVLDTNFFGCKHVLVVYGRDYPAPFCFDKYAEKARSLGAHWTLDYIEHYIFR
jgi:hypothetical protein